VTWDETPPHEARVVWLIDPGEMSYVRSTVVAHRRRRGPIAFRGFTVVGYTELRPDARSCRDIGGFLRRVFWLKPYDRYFEPRGTYACDEPAEAVDPKRVAPGRP
jgi:hypothetical protein